MPMMPSALSELNRASSDTIGVHKPPAASSALDQLQQRLQELQHQRQLLKRPSMAQSQQQQQQRPGESLRGGSKPRPRSAALPPSVASLRVPRPPERRSSGPLAAAAGSPLAAAEAAIEAASSRRASEGVPPRPMTGPPSGRGFAASTTRTRTAGGKFGPACGSSGMLPLFSTSSTPRLDIRESSTSSAEAERERSARTHMLRKLIRDGYQRLGLPVPTMTQSTALEPLLYRQEKVVGKGAFGLVSLARSVVTGELVAMKTIDRAKLHSENLKKTVEHEIRILKRLKHRRIVRLFEVIETPRSIHIILEYVDGGTVQQLVKKHKRLTEPDAQRLMSQLVDAVACCHSHHVCHRDLKLENFMLSRGGRSLTLIDFGLSVVWKEGQGLFKSYGTPCYMAPEIIKGNNYSGVQVDVWSLGVALATMLTGSLPFQGSGDTELKKRILRGQFPCPDHVSPEARDLLSRMLALNPSERIGVDAIRQHPWLAAEAERSPHEGSASARMRATGGAEAPLDADVLARCETLGLDPEDVKRSVHANAYNHESACYEMLLSAMQSDELQQALRSARESSRETSSHCETS